MHFLEFFVTAAALVPLGYIGAWRWGVWLFKKICSFRYRSAAVGYKSKVSIVTPVYDENPEIFTTALRSWISEKPDEIIAVIDASDKMSIRIFKRYARNRKFLKLIVSTIPGKRHALYDGIEAAQYPIIALVDSDTFWPKGTKEQILAPFSDPKVGGVSARQNVYEPKSITGRIFDMSLDVRYLNEYRFLSAMGHKLVCLSGRTAVYRASALNEVKNQLIEEKFGGVPTVSGDDKTLTLNVQNHWNTAHQEAAQVFTPAFNNYLKYSQQRLRWARNAWRYHFPFIAQAWRTKSWAFLFFLLDKTIQPFVIVYGFLYFVAGLYFHKFILAGVIFAWWNVGRFIRIFPHLREKPKDILIVPFFALSCIISGFINIYALFTLNTHKWITRGAASRGHAKSGLKYQLRSYGLMALVILLLSIVPFGLQKTINNEIIQPIVASKFFQDLFPNAGLKQDGSHAVSSSLLVGTDLSGNNPLTIDTGNTATPITRHVVGAWESLGSISSNYGVTLNSLISANGNFITSGYYVKPGTILTIPDNRTIAQPVKYLSYKSMYPRKDYDAVSDDYTIAGRGSVFTLSSLTTFIGDPNVLVRVGDKEYLLKKTVVIGRGVTLSISGDEVNWLKLESNGTVTADLKCSNCALSITNTKITSWDSASDNYDLNINDGRSYVLAKFSSRLDIENSELAFLGAPVSVQGEGGSYGVSWKSYNNGVAKYTTSGVVVNSSLHDNYYGIYLGGVTGMLLDKNVIRNNLGYGVAAIYSSTENLIQDNIIHDNATDGVFLSQKCSNNSIINNDIYNNGQHGIIAELNSDGNFLKANEVYNNDDGMAFYISSNNIITDNTVINNQNGMRFDNNSVQNQIGNNIVNLSRKYGIIFYGKSEKNKVLNNSIAYNETAMYVKTSGNIISQNTFTGGKLGVYFWGDQAKGNYLMNNNLSYFSVSAILTKNEGNGVNYESANQFQNNKKKESVSLIGTQ